MAQINKKLTIDYEFFLNHLYINKKLDTFK